MAPFCSTGETPMSHKAILYYLTVRESISLFCVFFFVFVSEQFLSVLLRRRKLNGATKTTTFGNAGIGIVLCRRQILRVLLYRIELLFKRWRHMCIFLIFEFKFKREWLCAVNKSSKVSVNVIFLVNR